MPLVAAGGPLNFGVQRGDFTALRRSLLWQNDRGLLVDLALAAAGPFCLLLSDSGELGEKRSLFPFRAQEAPYGPRYPGVSFTTTRRAGPSSIHQR